MGDFDGSGMSHARITDLRRDSGLTVSSYDRVIPFGMTRRAVLFCRPQPPRELLASVENTSDYPVWPVYDAVQSIGGRIGTEAELRS